MVSLRGLQQDPQRLQRPLIKEYSLKYSRASIRFQEFSLIQGYWRVSGALTPRGFYGLGFRGRGHQKHGACSAHRGGVPAHVPSAWAR